MKFEEIINSEIEMMCHASGYLDNYPEEIKNLIKKKIKIAEDWNNLDIANKNIISTKIVQYLLSENESKCSFFNDALNKIHNV